MTSDAPETARTWDSALAARRRWVALGLAAVAGLLRLNVFLELDGGPWMELHRREGRDMQFYDAWAVRIAGGDAASRHVEHLHTSSQRRVARTFLERYPDHPVAAAALKAGPSSSAAAQDAVWDAWYGGVGFLQEPLFPYLVGATYAVAGHDPRFVFAWQALLGVLIVLIVWAWTVRLFGDTAGLAAGALACLSGPLVFHEFLLLRETMIVLAAAGLPPILAWVWSGSTPGRSALAGLAAGAAWMVKGTFAPAAAAMVAAAMFPALTALAARLGLPAGSGKVPLGPRMRAALISGSAAVAGIAAALAPAMARNLAVGAPLMAFSGSAGTAFVVGNTPDFEAGAGFALSDRYAADILAASEGRLGPAVVATVAAHPSPGSYLLLLARKFLSVWHWYEGADNANLHQARLHSAFLGLARADFWVTASWAAVGAAVVLRRRDVRAATVIAATWAAFQLLPLVAFHSHARYRLPLLVALLPFAGLGLARTVAAAADRRWAGAALGAGVALAASAVMWRPLPPGRPLISPADFAYFNRAFYLPHAEEAAGRGELSEAAETLGRALAVAPPELREWEAGRVPADPGGRELAAEYAKIMIGRGESLVRAGREAEGRAEIERGRALARWLQSAK